MCFHSPPQNSKHVPGELGLGTNPAKCWVWMLSSSARCVQTSDFKTWPNLDWRCVPKLRTSRCVPKLRTSRCVPKLRTSRYVPKLRHQRCVQTQTLRCVPKLRLPTCVRNQNSRGVQIQTSRCVPKLRLPRCVRIQNSRYVQIQTSRCVQIQISKCVQIQTSRCAQTLTSKCVQTQVYWMRKSWKLKCGGLYHRDNHTSQTHSWTHTHIHITWAVKCASCTSIRPTRILVASDCICLWVAWQRAWFAQWLTEHHACELCPALCEALLLKTNEYVFSTQHRPIAAE